jgi:RNA polymerase sigma-70 factor, ECF subfamily
VTRLETRPVTCSTTITTDPPESLGRVGVSSADDTRRPAKGTALRRTCDTVRSVSSDEYAADRRARFEAIAPGLVEPLRRFLARRTDSATADDVLSETLLVCWRRLDDLPAEPLPWAYGVARNCLANAQRGARRQERLAARISVVDPPASSVPAPGEAGDPDLAEALAELRAEDAELLRLWAWEQLTPAEIAKVLDVTPNAVSIRLLRAREKLAEQLRKTVAAAGHEESNEGRRP